MFSEALITYTVLSCGKVLGFSLHILVCRWSVLSASVLLYGQVPLSIPSTSYHLHVPGFLACCRLRLHSFSRHARQPIHPGGGHLNVVEGSEVWLSSAAVAELASAGLPVGKAYSKWYFRSTMPSIILSHKRLDRGCTVPRSVSGGAGDISSVGRRVISVL